MLKIYSTMLATLTALRPAIEQIERSDSDLAKQMRRASTSVALNIAEGSYARGRNRKALYQVALGSAKETRACIDVALALGYLESVDGTAVSNLGSVCAVLYRLVT